MVSLRDAMGCPWAHGVPDDKGRDDVKHQVSWNHWMYNMIKVIQSYGINLGEALEDACHHDTCINWPTNGATIFTSSNYHG
jgi:hypothetical protein